MITTKQKLFSVVDEAGSSLEQVRGENFTQKQAAGFANQLTKAGHRYVGVMLQLIDGTLTTDFK